MADYQLYDPERAKIEYERQKAMELAPVFQVSRNFISKSAHSDEKADFRLETDGPSVIYHVYGPHGKQECFGPAGTYRLIRPAMQNNDNTPKP